MTYIPEYVKRAIGLPAESALTRENSGCTCIEEPTAIELQTERQSFINRARALLVALGYDPTPQNVDRVQQDNNDNTLLCINGKYYKVQDNDETLQELQLMILSHPERLPANFLALFFTYAFQSTLDFQVIRIVAQALKKANNVDAVWAMHQLINLDTQINSHLQEIIDNVGLQALFYKDQVQQVTYNGSNYVIVAVQPTDAITVNYDINAKCMQTSV